MSLFKHLITKVMAIFVWILTLKINSSTLSIDFVNPLQLEDESDYGMSLLFHFYKIIPNIDFKKTNFITTKISIKTGTYEITHIEAYIQKQ